MKLFFCEKCGKRLTDQDLSSGAALDKQAKGVHCKDCADGVMTLTFEALTDQEARKLVQMAPAAAPTAAAASTGGAAATGTKEATGASAAKGAAAASGSTGAAAPVPAPVSSARQVPLRAPAKDSHPRRPVTAAPGDARNVAWIAAGAAGFGIAILCGLLMLSSSSTTPAGKTAAAKASEREEKAPASPWDESAAAARTAKGTDPDSSRQAAASTPAALTPAPAKPGPAGPTGSSPTALKPADPAPGAQTSPGRTPTPAPATPSPAVPATPSPSGELVPPRTKAPASAEAGPDGLLIHLLFDGDLNDSGPLKLKGHCYRENPVFEDGIAGQAYVTKDGDKGNAVMLDRKKALYDLDSFTIACWVRVDKVAPRGSILVLNHMRWSLDIKAKGFSLGVRGVKDATLFECTVADGQWHHLAVMLDGKVLRGYLDGAALNTRDVPEANVRMEGTWAIAVMGSPWNGVTTGAMDDFRYYNRALTPEETAKLAKR